MPSVPTPALDLSQVWGGRPSFVRDTVGVVTRLEQLPNGHWAERYDHTPRDCRTCGKPLRSPNVSLGTSTCAVHGQIRDHTCRSCRTVHVDCSCVDVGEQQLGTGYFRAPAGQHGPTADFG